MIFNWFRKDAALDQAAIDVYATIVAQARHHAFYADFSVPDTLDGRFDMLVLHAFLVFHRLKGETAPANELSQMVFDEMMMDLDHTLREMGVGDISVGKRVKKMASAFYGRAQVYDEAVSAGDEDQLAAALERNLFPDGDAPHGVAVHLGRYVLEAAVDLRARPSADFVAGRISFINPPVAGIAGPGR